MPMLKRILPILIALSLSAGIALAQGGPFSAQIQRAFRSVTSPILFAVDNSVDIGANGANRPARVWAGTSFLVGSNGSFSFVSRSQLGSTADGVAHLSNNADTAGIRFQFSSSAPTISSGFGTSPSIVSSPASIDSQGAVNVGTGGAATSGVINFAVTWTNAPHCVADVETSTAANARAHGVVASTTQLTITAASAWVASSIVNWHCFGSR